MFIPVAGLKYSTTMETGTSTGTDVEWKMEDIFIRFDQFYQKLKKILKAKNKSPYDHESILEIK